MAGGIMQRAALQMQNIQRSSIGDESAIGGGIVRNIMGKNANDIHSIGDFDVDLANVIQEALSTAGESSSPTAGNSSCDKSGDGSANMMMGENDDGVFRSIGDFDVDLSNEIREALIVAEKSSPSPTADGESVDDEGDGSSSSAAAGNHSIESELLQSMTCAQLRERLRLRGMKVSGKKADLVHRLLLDGVDDGAIARNHNGNADDDGEVDDVPFFGTLR
jgi:hypothetical protein